MLRRQQLRERRRVRVRAKVTGTPQRPRLAVFRSEHHIYAQVIDDAAGHTLAAASSLDKGVREEFKYGGNVSAAKRVGQLIGERAKEAGVQQVVFDRGGFKFHGRIAAVAEGAREAGLEF